MNPPSQITVVQVLSSPHSGSTILGVLLGASEGIYYGGEMDRIPDPVWSSGLVCSCGQPTEQCPFWRSVRERFAQEHDVSRFEADQKRCEPWSALPRTIAATLVRARGLGRHARATDAFLRAVAESAGRPIVVDSSKLAARGLVYARARSRGLRVRYVHLVRDGRAVLASRKSRWSSRGIDTETPQFAAAMARRWLVANLTFAGLFAWRRRSYLRLRHEDLVRDPEGTLRRLERFLGVSLATPIAKIRDGSSFPVLHVPTGNRFRLHGEVRFRPAPAQGPVPVPVPQRRAFWRVAGGLARWYGYRKDPGREERPASAAPPAA